MYRYPQRRPNYNAMMRANRLRPILLIVLALVVVFLVIKFVGVGGLDENVYLSQRDSQLRSETQRALSQVNSLSRLGATSTSNILGRIRQYVHGVEILNDLNVSLYGEAGRMYAQDVFSNLYTIIDTYDARVSSGQKVTESLNTLENAINELSALTTALLGDGQAIVEVE